jgi:hypothetical protein
MFQIYFFKHIYRSLARVLRKLGRMALTLELHILQLAISLRNKIHSTRLSLALTSPYNIYYKAIVAHNIPSSWLHFVGSSPCSDDLFNYPIF